MEHSKVDFHGKNVTSFENHDGSLVLLPLRGRKQSLEVLRSFSHGFTTDFELLRVKYDLRSIGFGDFVVVLVKLDREDGDHLDRQPRRGCRLTKCM